MNRVLALAQPAPHFTLPTVNSERQVEAVARQRTEGKDDQ